MVLDFFDSPIAYNPDAEDLVTGATFQVFAVDDSAYATPLPVTDPASGANIPVLASNNVGVLPAFRVGGDPAQVVLKSGAFTTLLTSRYGIFLEVVPDPSALLAAIAAGESAQNALNAAQDLVDGIPAAIDEAVAGAGIPGIAADAVDADIDGRNIVEKEIGASPEWDWYLLYEGNREVAMGRRADGTYYPPILDADPAKIPDVQLEELTDDQGWRFAIRYSDDGEVAFGQRRDGSYFPSFVIQGTASDTSPLVFVGDSIAEGWASRSAPLATSLGRSIVNIGIGGQASPQIAARQGGAPARVTVSGNAIPGSGSVSVTALTESDGTPVSPLKLTGDGSRTLSVVIAGVAGVLTGVTSGSSATYTFTRSTAGEVMPCPPGSPMTAGWATRAHIPVLLGPRNDLGPSAGDAFREPLLDIVARFRAMLDWSTSPRALVLGVLPRSDATAEGRANLTTLNNALRDAFPQAWADWGAYLRTDAAFAAAGITKTADDITDIANGDTPRSFRNAGDIVHLNNSGYAAANHFIELTFASRGW